MNLNDSLKQFGLNEKESQVYLTCLELGLAGANEIAVKANIKRTSVYDVLPALEGKGLAGQTRKGKKRLFYAEEPEKLNKLLEEKQSRLLEILPVLKSLYNTAGEKPKIRYYQGTEGLKQVYRDTLSYHGELLAFISENIIIDLGRDFAEEYLAKRKKANLFARVIASDSPEHENYKKQDKEYLKQTRLVPPDKFSFTIEMNIYGNKLAFMSFKEEMGVIVESNEIAKNMRLLFELAWRGAGDYKSQ